LSLVSASQIHGVATGPTRPEARHRRAFNLSLLEMNKEIKESGRIQTIAEEIN
jgi:hypothetical protein